MRIYQFQMVLCRPSREVYAAQMRAPFLLAVDTEDDTLSSVSTDSADSGVATASGHAASRWLGMTAVGTKSRRALALTATIQVQVQMMNAILIVWLKIGCTNYYLAIQFWLYQVPFHSSDLTTMFFKIMCTQYL